MSKSKLSPSLQAWNDAHRGLLGEEYTLGVRKSGGGFAIDHCQIWSPIFRDEHITLSNTYIFQVLEEAKNLDKEQFGSPQALFIREGMGIFSVLKRLSTEQHRDQYIVEYVNSENKCVNFHCLREDVIQLLNRWRNFSMRPEK